MNIGIIVFTVLSIVSFYTFGKLMLKTLLSRNWKVTTAQIIHSEYKLENHDEIAGYRQRVLYEYTFGISKFTGNEIDFGIIKYDFVQRNEIQLKIGKTINIYVNPKNPSDSVIDRSLQPSAFLILFAGLIGITMVIFSLPNNLFE